nr:SDR family NAD(P)-dependent oxidoreductase [Lysinibacillus timonensis]
MESNQLIEFCLFRSTYLNKKKLKQNLEGKTILITGASSGIGAQVASELADTNCQLILVARREDILKELKNEIEQKCAKVSIFKADLRNQNEMEDLLAFLHSFPHGLDIVVSNAGISINRSIYDSLDRFHDFTRTMAINYFAPVQILLSTIPLLQKNEGHIINVSTINALLAPVPYFAAYQASKSSFDVWLRSVAPELKRNGVTTTSIYLPLVTTPMIEPTPSYRSMPALSASSAARVICKSMYNKKKKVQPWWLLFGQILSLFIRNFGDVTNLGRKKSSS